MDKLEEEFVAKIHEKLLQMLAEFDRICRKNNIKYILDGGSLLGAIRHKGFIPWDDDVDVAMLRKDYKRFIKACKKDLNTELFTLDTIEVSKFYSYNFGKLKMNGTIWEEDGSENVKEHKGLYIDIFPLDNTCKLFYKLQSSFAGFWEGVRWKKIKREYPCNHAGLMKFLSKIMPLKLINFNAQLSMRMFNWIKTKNVCKICHYGKGKEPHSRRFYEDIIDVPFEKYYFYAPRENEEWLDKRYSNWREMPPIEKRNPTHKPKNFKI